MVMLAIYKVSLSMTLEECMCVFMGPYDTDFNKFTIKHL